MKKIYLIAGLWAALCSAKAQQVASFDDFELEPGSWYNGADETGGFSSGSFWFPNDYNADWGSWAGFSVSNLKNDTTSGYGNQYSAITAGGVNGSENYAVVYFPGELKMELENPVELAGFYVTNSTWAYLAMRDGDDFSKKFGGEDGTDPDWFKLAVSGVDIYGNETEEIEFFLADYTAENPEDDYLVDTWEWLDLTGLGVVTALNFSLESTDVGDWGMNTPAYFCLDELSQQDLSPVIQQPIADIDDPEIYDEVFYVELDSVFTDPNNKDSGIQLKLEYIDNPTLLSGSIVTGGKPGEPEKTMLALNAAPGVNGEAVVYISGTSNGKKAWHSFKVVITVPVSSPIAKNAQELSVFPNPVKDLFFVEIPGNAESMVLIENTGRLIYQKALRGQSRVRVSALNGLPAGIYFLRVKTEGELVSRKILKY